MRLRIQLRDIIRIRWFRTLDIFAPEVGKLWNLVSEHFLDRLRGEDAALGERRDTVIEQRRDYLGVVRRACVTTCAGAVINGGDFVGWDEERAAI